MGCTDLDAPLETDQCCQALEDDHSSQSIRETEHTAAVKGDMPITAQSPTPDTNQTLHVDIAFPCNRTPCISTLYCETFKNFMQLLLQSPVVILQVRFLKKFTRHILLCRWNDTARKGVAFNPLT